MRDWPLVALLAVTIAIVLAIPVWLLVRPACVKSHRATVHHSMWIQYVHVGKTMVPIVHPSRDAEEDVCDCREGEVCR